MQAIVRHDYGGPEVLAVEEVDRPAAGDDRVVVRVRAAALNPLDWHFLTGTPYLVRARLGLRRPKEPILGADAAGVVEEVGSGVSDLRPGDEVFGEVAGAFAEYVAARPGNLARKPANATFEDAAALPVAGLTALQGLRDVGRLEAGQHVLVNGASGGVGTFAVQIAKALGAEVTGVCSTRNVELVRSIGADHVLDYARDDFAAAGHRYDVLLDNVGNRPLADYRRVVKPGGTYVMVSGPKHRILGPMRRVAAALVISPFLPQRMVTMLARATREDLTTLAGLVEAGQVTPVIDHRYRLADAADGIRRQADGHARGKSVVTV